MLSHSGLTGKYCRRSGERRSRLEPRPQHFNDTSFVHQLDFRTRTLSLRKAISKTIHLSILHIRTGHSRSVACNHRFKCGKPSIQPASNHPRALKHSQSASSRSTITTISVNRLSIAQSRLCSLGRSPLEALLIGQSAFLNVSPCSVPPRFHSVSITERT